MKNIYLIDTNAGRQLWTDDTDNKIIRFTDVSDLAELERKLANSQEIVGEIDYYSTDGKVYETMRYTDRDIFEAQVKEDNYVGMPMGITTYGESTIKLEDLDPPPLGFKRVSDRPLAFDDTSWQYNGDVNMSYEELKAKMNNRSEQNPDGNEIIEVIEDIEKFRTMTQIPVQEREIKTYYVEPSMIGTNAATEFDYKSRISKKSFEYGNRYFVPVRKFNAKDGDFFKITQHLHTDNELGFLAADYLGKQKFAYSYDDFYKAYGSKDCDIFRCVGNGKLYIPCQYELQRYEPEKVKSKDFDR